MINKLHPVIMIWLLIFTGSLSAQESWRDGTYFKQSVAGTPQTIQQLLSDFGKAQKVPVIYEGVPEILVNAQYQAMTPVNYLDAITQDNGLTWFESADVIYVSKASDIESRVLPLNQVDLDRLLNVLKRFGVYTDRFPIRSDAQVGVVYIVGPKRYLDEVEKIASDVDAAVRRQASVDVEMRIIYLQHAWADDRVFTIGQNQVAVPGVATVLKSIVSGKSIVELQGQASRILPFNRPGLNGQGLISPYNQILAETGEAALRSQFAAEKAQAQYDAVEQYQRQIASGAPSDAKADAEAKLAAQVETVIQPYARLNAIIIKDLKERIDGLESIIKQLDQPVGLVQIKATLIDIDANYAYELGTPYNVMWNKDGIARGLQLNLETSSIANLATDPGNFTIRLVGAGVDEFLANFRALEADGHARMVAKPSVLTLDNSEAYLEEAEEFYVRVQGNQQVDLFNVLVGTQLFIAPHIINHPQGRRVKLNIRIEDGSRSETASVDEIPVVSRNTINTQAELLEGQSLLIGGLMREEESKTERGIPVLSRIPRVGALFRETKHETQRVERLVMLTPTLIDLPCESGSQFPPSSPSQTIPPQLVPPEPNQYIPPASMYKLPPVESMRQISQEQLKPVSPGAREGQASLSDYPASTIHARPVPVRQALSEKLAPKTYRDDIGSVRLLDTQPSAVEPSEPKPPQKSFLSRFGIRTSRNADNRQIPRNSNPPADEWIAYPQHKE